MCEHPIFLCNDQCFNYAIDDELEINTKKEEFVDIVSAWDLAVIEVYDKTKETFRVPYS